MPKPTLFIGSSVETVSVANTLQLHLKYDAVSNVWNQGIFGISSYTLDGLLVATKKFDFAAFVFGADDTVLLRGTRYLVARDNVTLEFGIFAGALGRERTFIILQETAEPLHLPSDLLGINTAKFSWPNKNFEDRLLLNATLGPVAEEIRNAMASANAQKMDDSLSSLSGGMIFLALWLQGQSHTLHNLVEPFKKFQTLSARLGPHDSAYAAKAAKYGCQCLEAVGMAEQHGGDEYSLTPLGKDLLGSDAFRLRFKNSYKTFETLNEVSGSPTESRI